MRESRRPPSFTKHLVSAMKQGAFFRFLPLRIHGTHRVHGSTEHTEYMERFWLKIFLKIFVMIYTIGYFLSWLSIVKARFHYVFATPKIRVCKAIPIKIFPKSEELERIFSQDFYLKILFPSNIRLNSDDWFLAKQHLKQDFLQRFTYGLFCRDSA